MKTFFKISGLVIILGVFGYTLYFLWAKSKEKPVVYETETPFYTDVIKKTVATGSIVPRKEIEIKPVVSGIVDELYVEEGDMVKKGDLIAKIRIIPDMINLNNAKSRIEKAKINLKDAKRNYDRQFSLLEKGVIAKADFESYEIAYQTAQEELKTAEETLELIREGQIKKSGAPTNTLVRSTISGMVLDVPVETGNQVIESNNFNAGTTIATIADMNDMIFKGKIDETEVGKIHEKMNLILSIGAIDDTKFDAMLTKISPKGVEENGAIQFEIEANVNLKENRFIRAGYSANADIVLDRADSVMVIPESLLMFENDTTYVEVETGEQQFEKRIIKTGLSDGINIQVISGLDKSDKIRKPS
ncbi:MAG TPA: efflux RND transporter periplasmic adaptor subunit [Bacteroidetes bacterium]|nr:efflux RND transporter periplasmic adaptor subunit [Bacteroidota bacterium]